MFFVARLGRTGLGHTDGFSIDSLNDSFPSSQGFFQGKLDVDNEVVTGSCKDIMFLLYNSLASTLL